MAIDYSISALPKPRSRVLEKREAKAELDRQDRYERKLCHLRSGGRCEARIVTARPECSALIDTRCNRAASHNHHLMGGHGRRNVGDSILAVHRLDVCTRHHSELHHRLLQAVDHDWQYDAAMVRFEKVER